VNPEVPWPALRDLGVAPAHLGTGGRREATTVVDASANVDPVPSTQAAVVAQVAANGLDGSIADLLNAAILLVQGAELRSTPPMTNQFTETLNELARPTN
jgi:hypothetical protein